MLQDFNIDIFMAQSHIITNEQYICLTCKKTHLNEQSILESHYTHFLLNEQDELTKKIQTQLINNRAVRTYLQEINMKSQILGEMVCQKIDEISLFEEKLQKCRSTNDVMKLLEEYEDTEHSLNLINSYLNKFYCLEKYGFRVEEIIHMEIKKLSQYSDLLIYSELLTQYSWEDMCLKLQSLSNLSSLSLCLSKSNVQNIHIQILLEELIAKSNICNINIELENTQITNKTLDLIQDVININKQHILLSQSNTKLQNFSISIQYTCISSEDLNKFWKQNKQIIKNKFRSFYILNNFNSLNHLNQE